MYSSADIYIYTFSRRFDPKHSGYTFIISMCVPWELNPQPFALLTLCSTTEPQEHNHHLGRVYVWIETQNIYKYIYIFPIAKSDPMHSKSLNSHNPWPILQTIQAPHFAESVTEVLNSFGLIGPFSPPRSSATEQT